MVSTAGLGQMAMNLGAQAFFVVFVWRLARRFSAAGGVVQEQVPAPRRDDGQGVCERE
jgi:hypothetical protein